MCVCVYVCDYTHCNASVVHFFVNWITVLLLVLWRITHITGCPLPRRWSLGSEAPAGVNRGQQSQATIPFSSMSWFSLLQIDVDVEEPVTSENPMQSVEIHSIVWRLTQLLAVIVYVYYMMNTGKQDRP